MFYGGTVFTVGWLARILSSHDTSSLDWYIVQNVLILAGPPIYSAAGYNILSRLMNYVPMHAPLHPRRVYIFFVYLGAAVESLTAAGGSLMASNPNDLANVRLAGTLISIALVLQGAVECLFISFVALIHSRCAKSHMLSSNIRSVCFLLYGSSALVLARCIFRAIDSFATRTPMVESSCPRGSLCDSLYTTEWPLYAFEAAPMLLYTVIINITHPGALLPRQRNRYLDTDGRTERIGPERGWIDKRSTWQTYMDPFDLQGVLSGHPAHEMFWLEPDKWEVCQDGSFATGTATNVRRRKTAAGTSTAFGNRNKNKNVSSTSGVRTEYHALKNVD